MSLFKDTFSRCNNNKETNKKALEVLNKKKNKRAPVTTVVPKTMKDKVEYAKMMSTKIFSDRLDRMELVTSEERIDQYLDKVLDNGILAVDTETNGLDRIDGKIAGICLYTPGEKGIYIPVGHVSYMTNMELKNNVSKEFMRNFFEVCNRENIKYVLQNSKYDMHILYWMIGVKIVPYWDTLIGGYLLNENEPHGLKALWQKYCTGESAEVGKFGELFNGIEFNKIPPDVGYMYAAFDPIMTYELYDFQREYLDRDGKYCYKKGLERVADVFRNIEMPLIEVVFDMEAQGVDIDTNLAQQLKQRYTTYMDNALNEFNTQVVQLDEQGAFNDLRVKHPDKYGKISELGEVNINIGSNQQLVILFYDVLKLDPPKGQRSVGEEQLKQLNHPLVSCILEYRGMSKLLSTYIDAIPDHISKRTGKLHANFNQYGAKTGRFSSSNPNLQNLPSKTKKLSDGTVIDAGHDIRQMFIAGEGNVIIGGDFSQQEPRCLAHMSGDKHMIQAYLDGKDLYSTIASKLYNQPYEECKEFRPDGTVNPEGKNRRSSVKPILLGIMYGRGVTSIAEQMNISKEEAQQVINDFYDQFPNVKGFVDFAQENARTYGFVETAWGRKRRLPNMQLDPIEITVENPNLVDTFNPLDFTGGSTTEVSDEVYFKYLKLMRKAFGKEAKEKIKQMAKDEGYKLVDNGGYIADAQRQCVNSIIQGSAADMTKIAMIQIHDNKRLQELGYKLIIPVHDEVLGVCPKENAEEVRDILEHIMVHVVDGIFEIPMKTDIEVTYRWYGEGIEI
jgi:DNA polymerase I-like protein with 3'-5' exonuclease and polymerase domains|nr:MAG TPA: DNA polymerase [Caudoviricetes sp.]